MTANLEIRSDATGALSALTGIRDMVEACVKANERLAAITVTLRQHWRDIGNDLTGLKRQLDAIATVTQTVAGSSRYVHAGFEASVAAAQKLSQELARARTEAANTARIINATRAPSAAPSTSSFTFSGGNVPGFTISPPTTTVPSAPSAAGTTGGSGGFFDRNRSTYGAGLGGIDLGIGKAAAASISSIADMAQSVVGRGLRFAWREFETAGKVALATTAGLFVNSIRLAMKAAPIEIGFKNLVSANDLGNEAAVISELRNAARGTVSDLDLMQSANKALMLGAAKTTDELKLLIEGGRRLGATMGLDATEGFERLATGIGRQSAKILDDLGIKLKASEVYENYARSVKTTVGHLSEEEKQVAYVSAAYAALKKHLEDQGDEQETANMGVARAVAAFENLSEHFGKRFLPALGEVANRWAKFIDDLKPAEIEKAFSAATTGVNDVVKNTSGTLSKLFGSVWDAFTNPSRDAFKVVELRFEQMINKFKGWLESVWVSFLKTGDKVATMGKGMYAMSGLPGAETMGKWFERDSKAIDDAIAVPEKEADAKNARIEDQIRKISARMTAVTAASAAANASSSNPYAWNGVLASKSTGAAAPREAEAAAATARREAEEASARAEKDQRESMRRGLQSEIRLRESVVRTLERENRANEAKRAALGSSITDASAALLGQDAPKTIAARLGDLSDELREYPERFKRIGEKIDENSKSMTDAMKSWDEEFQRTLADLNRNIRLQANAFLQEGPQDGESVRVRALKRRAQKEQRRYNSDLVNDAFRSPSFEAFGGDLGGFGSQGTERTPRVLGQRFPALEQALLRMKQNDGTTQLEVIQERVSETVREHLDELKKAREKQGEQLREQAAAHAEQKRLQNEITELLKASATEYADLSRAVQANAATIASIKRENEKTAQAVRSLK